MKYVKVKKRENIVYLRRVYNITGRSKGWLKRTEQRKPRLHYTKISFPCDVLWWCYNEICLRWKFTAFPTWKQSASTSQRYSFYWADIARVKVDVIIWWKKTFECTRKGGREIDVTMKLYIIKLGYKRTGSSRAEIFWYRNQNNLCLNK